jgi:hypothetical protein
MGQREEWFEGRLSLNPERLIIIDETTASNKMARLYGRAKRLALPGCRPARSLEIHDLHRFRPVPLCSRCILDKNTLASNGPKGKHLKLGFLILG